MIARTVSSAAGAGKSDTIDAVEAARAALSGRASGITKTADGDVEAIRALLVARRSGRNVRIKYLNQIRHLGFAAPDELRERFGACPAAVARPRRRCDRPPGWDRVVHATNSRSHARTTRPRARGRRSDISTGCSTHRCRPRAPSLLEVYGVGTHTAAILLVAVGDNPHRLRSEAAFAHLCGVAPLPASSGKVDQHRLNPGGNRQANHALWRIVFTRMSSDARTREYVARRISEGLKEKSRAS